MTNFSKFLGDDKGAVTIDWVALTAGILLLGIIVIYAIFNGGVAGLVSNINATLAGVDTDIDTGTVPNMSGGGSGGDAIMLADNSVIPVGSVFNTDMAGNHSATAPDGTIIPFNIGPIGVPDGSVLSSTSTITVPDSAGGGTFSAADFGLI